MATSFRQPTKARLSCTVERFSDGVVVVIAGELDSAVAPDLRTVLQAVLDDEPPRLVVDMAGISFVDSTGIGVLVGAARRTRSAGVTVALRSPTRATMRVLELTGLRGTFEIC